MNETSSTKPRRSMKFDVATQIATIEQLGSFDASGLSEQVKAELLGLGFITALVRSTDAQKTYAAMRDGTWGRRGEAAPKPMTEWQRAIMAVRVNDMVAAKRHETGKAPSKDDRAAIEIAAEEYARSRTPAQIQWARGIDAVRIEHAKLTGTKGSLADMPDATTEKAPEGPPPSGDVQQEAAE